MEISALDLKRGKHLYTHLRVYVCIFGREWMNKWMEKKKGIKRQQNIDRDEFSHDFYTLRGHTYDTITSLVHFRCINGSIGIHHLSHGTKSIEIFLACGDLR